MRRALEAAGDSEATIAAVLATLPVEAADVTELDEGDEGQAVALFLALGESWHRAGMDGVRTGIINSEIAPTAALTGVTMTPALFVDLKAMEAEALRVFASQRPKG